MPQEWCKYWPQSTGVQGIYHLIYSYILPYEDIETLIGLKYGIVPSTELDRQKVEQAWQSRMPTNSALRSLLMRMVNTKPESRPSISEILADPCLGHVEFSNDTFNS